MLLKGLGGRCRNRTDDRDCQTLALPPHAATAAPRRHSWAIGRPEWLASSGTRPYSGQALIPERPCMTERRLISSGSRFEEQIGYSRAVVDGDYAWVSGTTGFDYKTMTLREGVVAQATQC